MFDRFDIIAAYYLFGMNYHSGQFSTTYTYISRTTKLGFNPGFLFSFDSLSDNAKNIYENLILNQSHGKAA